ncbi:MAG: ABC transporter ATP-binding protein [Phycisphaerales bacterium]|nr:MAG: ABC transporter ATP-binding protein [Phycisphaerales bacterium]
MQQANQTSPDQAAAERDPSSGSWVIRCQGLGKRFKIYSNPWLRLAEWAALNRPKLHREFWAVRGVSFELQRGQCLGVIGRNGSGKSTLLKLITGVMIPTEGTSAIRGRVLSLIELGAGLNKELTGRQNVTNMAGLLNFPPGFAREKMDQIESFADIGAFFDRPVRSYSSGMTVRLTFSMFAAFEPEVLIVDEALSVGDVFFVQKCVARIHELLERGTTMLLVSHDAGAITNLCDRAILLENGQVAFDGAPVDAVARYHAALRRGGGPQHGNSKWVAAKPDPASSKPSDKLDDEPALGVVELAQKVLQDDVLAGSQATQRRHGRGALRIIACALYDDQDRPASVLGIGERLCVRVLVEASQDVAQPRVGVRLINRFGTQVFGQGTMQLGTPMPSLHAGDRILASFTIDLQLAPGEYTLGLSASEPDGSGDPNGAVFHDHINGLGPIRITHPPLEPLPFFGTARLPMTAACVALTDQAIGHRRQQDRPLDSEPVGVQQGVRARVQA